MWSVEIQLQYATDVLAPGPWGGWYLPAVDPSAWLTACVDAQRRQRLWPLANHSPSGPDVSAESAASLTTRHFLVPIGQAEDRTTALVALFDSPAESPLEMNWKSCCPEGAIPLFIAARWPHSQLMIPLSARLDPAEQVWWSDAAADWQWAYVIWLPPTDQSGPRLIGLRKEDEIDLSVMLRPPAQARPQAARWQAPPPSRGLPSQLMQLAISKQLLAPNLFQREQTEIGGQHDQLTALDAQGSPQGGGVGAALGRWYRQTIEQLAKVVAQAKARQRNSDEAARAANLRETTPTDQARQQPANSQARSGVVRQFSDKLLEMLAAQRDRQIEKLLNLLAKDPEQGLKYAIPMGQSGLPRGQAPPSGELSEQGLDFSLAKLFGGGRSADVWHINAQLQAKLRQAYYREAQREQAAGRYRRAAYIYAHLLGDYNSAAMVLEKGKFYLEAARLYERLRRPRDQARCLQHSGQIPEAARLLESLRDFLSAAQLWQSIGQVDQARADWQQAVDELIGRGDILKAAELLKQQLDAAARAEELLWKQWPEGHQVRECMLQAFDDLARDQRVIEADQRLSLLIAHTRDRHQTLLASICLELAQKFPCPQLRLRAEDQCRLSVADRLAKLSQAEYEDRMQLLKSLHRGDLMLRRDIRRRGRIRESMANDVLTRNPSSHLTDARSNRRNQLLPLSSVALPVARYIWGEMVAGELLALGARRAGLQAMRFRGFDDTRPQRSLCTWNGTEWHPGCRLSLSISSKRPVEIDIAYGTMMSGQMTLRPSGVPINQSLSDSEDVWTIHKHTTEYGTILGRAEDGTQWWQCEERLIALRAGLPEVFEFASGQLDDADTEQALTIDLTDEEAELFTAEYRPLGCVLGLQPVAAVGAMLLSVRDGRLRRQTMANSILCVAPSMPYTARRVLVGTRSGLFVVHANLDARPEQLANDDCFRAAIFLPGGRIAALGRQSLYLFQRDRLAYVLRDQVAIELPKPLSLLRLSAESVGILFAHGVIQRWRIT